MRQMIEAEPDFDWRLTTLVDGGSVVAAEWTWTATYKGDSPIGHVVRFHGSRRGASVAVIENGRIKRFSDYYDFASFFHKALAAATKSNK
jgi:SnoaL-like protein